MAHFFIAPDIWVKFLFRVKNQLQMLQTYGKLLYYPKYPSFIQLSQGNEKGQYFFLLLYTLGLYIASLQLEVLKKYFVIYLSEKIPKDL